MLVNLRRAAALSIVMIVICLAYTLLETAVGQTFFSYQANGSLVHDGRAIVASSNIGQPWTGPKWFQGRNDPFDTLASGPTNYGPRSEQLYQQVRNRMRLLEAEGIVPTNGLVTGSASGLDPDISPADAKAQVDSVAKANHLPVSEVLSLVRHFSAPVYLGVFGAPYVNVYSLNAALAELVAGR